MTLREIKELLDAEVLVGYDQLDKEVKTAFGADLMSDVLAFAKAGSLLLTGLTNPQVIRTSDVLDIAAIIMVRGKRPSPETLPQFIEHHPRLQVAYRRYPEHGITKGLSKYSP